MGRLQILYVVAVIAIFVSTIASTPTPPPGVTPENVVSHVMEWSKHWTKLLIATSTVFIVWYTSRATHGIGHHEGERRKIVAWLLRHLMRAVDPTRIGSEFEARMDDICKLVRLDIEEFLNLKPQDVNVLLLAYAKDDGNTEGGFFLLGRDPLSNEGYFGHGSTKLIPASWLISYDCVWRSEHFVMHDTKARLVENHWGNLKMDWCRTVYSTAIKQRDSDGECLATLTIQLRYPYLLWPRRWMQLETRLRLYKDWVNAFLGNSPAKQHDLNRVVAPDLLLG